MVATAVRKSLKKLKFYREIQLPDFASKEPIPIRHFDFKFDATALNTRFFRNTELASAYFEALSIFLTFGEDLVIETARYHRDFVQDPILKQRVTALIGQEAIHSKIHNEWNETLKKHDFPVEFYRFLAKNVFDYGFLKFPQPLKLSLMAGIEHFTAVIAEYAMKHEYIFDEIIDDEKTKALWQWHMLEESEHKDIAYDVYQLLNGSYALRMAGFALASFTIIGLVSLGGFLIPFLRKPTNMISPSFWKDAFYSAKVILSPKDGLYGSTLSHLLDYMRPDFHPNDHDTSEYLAYYKDKLLNQDTGLLGRYLTKEFFPPVRAA
ncbi:MAG: metal-dependent hydrolase [Moraxellaceae bacterium]|nr:MAG: metal-dependent hydrolase [Moraxellaceae bacterium]